MTDKLRLRLHRDVLWAYAQIVLGCIVGGAAYPLFLTPGQIAPGGLSGVAMILNHLFGTPVGLMSIILNVPLFLVGFRAMGSLFVFRSLLGTFLFSICIDILQLPAMTMDPMLGCIFGGIMLGAGLGLIMRGSATTGGTDMMARMVHKHLPFITTGTFLFIFDFLVVVGAGFFIGAEEALYALICIFVSSKVLDMVMIGVTTNKACFIVSDHWEAVTTRILNNLERGVTHLVARGAYSGKERPVILCIMPASEVSRMKKIVIEEDANAFVFITDAHEALGEGFSKLSGDGE